ncbi:MAG: hypothetical protein ACM3OG_11425 [Actinomycetota bacterium]
MIRFDEQDRTYVAGGVFFAENNPASEFAMRTRIPLLIASKKEESIRMEVSRAATRLKPKRLRRASGVTTPYVRREEAPKEGDVVGLALPLETATVNRPEDGEWPG